MAGVVLYPPEVDLTPSAQVVLDAVLDLAFVSRPVDETCLETVLISRGVGIASRTRGLNTLIREGWVHRKTRDAVYDDGLYLGPGQSIHPD